MHFEQKASEESPRGAGSSPIRRLVLAIDTCGPTGSIALGSLTAGVPEILDQAELEGRSYSATLVSAVADLLARHGARLNLLHAMVAINGPGSFTGVRVGLSAVKGFAEAAQIPVVAVSRLEVLASRAGAPSSALDAHRREVYLRLAVSPVPARELLAGPDELANLPAPATIAVCDDPAAALLAAAWPAAEQLRTSAPTAADALRLCASRIHASNFIDLALLDAHYLRRSDAEIFGEAAKAPAP